ncbi:MAG: NDP-sugar synthase [Deltaproteobacteria bacterium]|nr:NDP-sugar synthase [Deltaproteobacteria bacterium]HDM10757.1 NDP-sugar synthase [Desulfobacteraceae bacterium]
MKAMILAAGYGTRLEPLTAKRPKALVPVANIPMVDRIIAYLKQHGVTEIVINAHHMHRQITSHFANPARHGVPIHVAVEEEILGTGGGIKNVEDFWDDEPFIVINVDILTDIDISMAMERHWQSKALATLVLHHYPQFNVVCINTEGHVDQFKEKTGPGLLAFTGIHVLSQAVLDYIPRGAFYSIIDVYRRIIQDKGTVTSYISKGHYWRDIGTIESYIQANMDMLTNHKILVGQDAAVHPTASLSGWVIVGHKCSVGEGAHVEDSIFWDGVQVGKGAIVANAVVTQDVKDWEEVKSQVL